VVSVVIPNLDSPTINDVIDCICKQTCSAIIEDIVVVGIDNTHPIAPNTRIQKIDTGSPISAASARNQGARQTRSDWLLFVDSDVLMQVDALAQLIESVKPERCAATLAAVVLETQPYWRQCSNLMAFPEYLSHDTRGERFALPSYCLLVPRDIWEKVGEFDTAFHGAAGEDFDWCIRARKLGYTTLFEPRARVYHRPAQRDTRQSVMKRFMAFGNAMYRVYKMHPAYAPASLAIKICERGGWFAKALLAPLAMLYVLRMAMKRPSLFQYARFFAGASVAQYAFYLGMCHAEK
jgi:GT2 family glycosyltransferase